MYKNMPNSAPPLNNMHPSRIELSQIDQHDLPSNLPIKERAHSLPPKRSCIVCYDRNIQLTASLFNCEHKDMCLQCINQYVDHCLQQKNLPKCQKEGCPGEFQITRRKEADTLLKHFISVQLQQILQKGGLRNDKKCSEANCYGFIRNGTCDLCLTNFCQRCYKPQHLGECEQKQVEVPDYVKRCPICGQGIQKSEGCMHMKCSCKHQFCLSCGQNWSFKHFLCTQSQKKSCFN